MLLKTLLIPLTCLITYFIPLILAGKWKDGDVRLVGGGRRYRGTVLVYRKKRWGAICDAMWGLNDANVACKQLGFSGATSAPTKSKFGPGRRRKWLTRVRCSGREKNILQCPHDLMRTVGKHTCRGLSRAAGVVCAYNKTKRRRKNLRMFRRKLRNKSRTTAVTTTTTSSTTIPTTTPTTTSTTTTTTATTTTTTTTVPTTTTTPEKTTASTTEATTTTTQHIMSGLEEEIALWASNGTHNETTMELDDEDLIKDHEKTKNDAPIVEIPFAITGGASAAEKELIKSTDENVNADMIQEPDKGPEKESKEKSDKELEVVAVKIPGEKSDKDSEKETDKDSGQGLTKRGRVLADAPVHQNLELRLLGGRYPWEGRLEVREEGGKWGVICSDHWSMREVMVSCNQIGGLGMGKQPLVTSYFGGANVVKHYYRIDCGGREDNLGKCNLTKSDQENVCSKQTNVAGIVCSNHLPDLVPHLRALELSARLQDQPLYYLRCSMEENCLARSAYVLRNTSPAWRNNMRRLFRFSTVVHNSGNADFRPYRGKDTWEWHSCHMHYHSMEVFAHYDIMDSEGNRLAEGSKASFCLEDTVCDQGIKPKYNCRGLSDQGLSVNCSDNYMYDIDCQWIDVTDLKPGHYTFLMEVNPSLLVAESNFDNNVASCQMYYNGYYAHLRNCEHQSLLDFREPRPLK